MLESCQDDETKVYVKLGQVELQGQQPLWPSKSQYQPLFPYDLKSWLVDVFCFSS